jgi:LmbE family N-acetylglucosaminyl deacetylase
MPLHVYLSPHLDDAALSCGGMIHRQTRAGERVIVATICAGDPPPGPLSEFAQSLHQRWQTPAEAVAARRAEDLAALAVLGAEAVHFPIPDCIYRIDSAVGQHLYASEDSLFGELHPLEAALIQQTAAEISRLLSGLGPSRLYAPLGIGRHVDHQLTRRAAEAAGSVSAYFEDYPYAARAPVSAPGASRRALAPEVIPLAEADLAAKVRAIAAYASQIGSFWSDPVAMEAAVREFARRTGGGPAAERLWRAAQGQSSALLALQRPGLVLRFGASVED